MKQRSLLVISKGAQASSTRYRATGFFPLLEAAGWTCSHITDKKRLLTRWRILKAAREHDIVLVSRRASAGLYLRLLRKASQRLIFDFDDAIFTRSRGDSAARQHRFSQMAACCDEVWAGNDYLAAAAAPYNPRVIVLPTAVDTDRYHIECTRADDHLDLVWIGSHSTGKYLSAILPALEAALEFVPNLRLKIIADFELKSGQLPIQCIDWSEDIEASEIRKSHIGISPLPDDPWTRGKCGLKILQYMAAGLPVIASPVGVNTRLCAENSSGILAQDNAEWVAAIRRLACEPETRAAMGERGRALCEAEYSQQVVFRQILQRLESMTR